MVPFGNPLAKGRQNQFRCLIRNPAATAYLSDDPFKPSDIPFPSASPDVRLESCDSVVGFWLATYRGQSLRVREMLSGNRNR
jgi:hypothetical protein